MVYNKNIVGPKTGFAFFISCHKSRERNPAKDYTVKKLKSMMTSLTDCDSITGKRLVFLNLCYFSVAFSAKEIACFGER